MSTQEEMQIISNPESTVSVLVSNLPPLSRALECERLMEMVQTEIDQLTKIHISSLADQIQELVAIRQEAIKEATRAGIKQDDKAVLVEKTRSSPRKILAKVLKEKDEPLYNAVILSQEKTLDQKKESLKDQKEMPVGVTEDCYKEIHGKGFDDAPIFEPVMITVDYSVISIEAKKIQDQIEASKKAKTKAFK
jgi:hypothetical protein